MKEEKAGLYNARSTDLLENIDFTANVIHLKFVSLTSSVSQPVEFNAFYITCQFSGHSGVEPTITWFKDGTTVSFIRIKFKYLTGPYLPGPYRPN